MLSIMFNTPISPLTKSVLDELGEV
jgi:hypothetical protein